MGGIRTVPLEFWGSGPACVPLAELRNWRRNDNWREGQGAENL
jgi:hypothetical protein